jgi:hypothetical protein
MSSDSRPDTTPEVRSERPACHSWPRACVSFAVVAALAGLSALLPEDPLGVACRRAS